MNSIKTRQDYLYLPNIERDINIVHISDVHFNINIKNTKLKKISEHILNLHPDYVMITGDLVDAPSITRNKDKIKELIDFLLTLSNRTKVMISIGNHDIFCPEDYIFFNEIAKIPNIYVLDNQSYQDENIFISGVTLPNGYYYNITKSESAPILCSFLEENKQLTTNLPADIPKIALIHSPIRLTDDNVFEHLKAYDVILTGHTHNGMLPDSISNILPGNWGIVSPNKKLFPKIARGKIIKEETTIIINGSITKLSLLSGKSLHRFNFVYDASVNRILIRKKEK